jgi:hypothetical protein
LYVFFFFFFLIYLFIIIIFGGYKRVYFNYHSTPHIFEFLLNISKTYSYFSFFQGVEYATQSTYFYDKNGIAKFLMRNYITVGPANGLSTLNPTSLPLTSTQCQNNETRDEISVPGMDVEETKSENQRDLLNSSCGLESCMTIFDEFGNEDHEMDKGLDEFDRSSFTHEMAKSLRSLFEMERVDNDFWAIGTGEMDMSGETLEWLDELEDYNSEI